MKNDPILDDPGINDCGVPIPNSLRFSTELFVRWSHLIGDSIHFDVQINVADEFETRIVAHGAQHQKEHVATEECVSEELKRL